MKKFSNYSSGQSLTEILISASILVIAVLGTLALLNRALGLNRVVAEHYTATYLAAEGLEITRNFFDKTFFEASNGDFYGWTGLGSLAPAAGRYRIFQIDYDEINPPTDLDCTLDSEIPTSSAVSKVIFECRDTNLKPLTFADGFYSNDLSGKATKFKRIIIIDRPEEFDGVNINLDYRVTSAVGWETRGGRFVVQLQDHFLPWRIP